MSGGIFKKKCDSAIWLACATIAARLRSTKSRTSTTVVMIDSGEPKFVSSGSGRSSGSRPPGNSELPLAIASSSNRRM